MNNKDDEILEELTELEEWRKERGISQEAMARKLDVALVTYSSWVTGKTLKFSMENYFKIGRLLTKLNMHHLYCPTKDLYIPSFSPEASKRKKDSTCPVCLNSDCNWERKQARDFVDFDDIEGPKIVFYGYNYGLNDDRITDLRDDRVEGFVCKGDFIDQAEELKKEGVFKNGET